MAAAACAFGEFEHSVFDTHDITGQRRSDVVANAEALAQVKDIVKAAELAAAVEESKTSARH